MPSRNISISLPEEMIQQANQLAAREQRTLSELFREAFRVYRAQQLKRASEEAAQNASTSNRSGFKEQELTRIAKELRAELETNLTPDR
jgi:metal-responsive CopG/Arc/MetJ family transcriptional regulator